MKNKSLCIMSKMTTINKDITLSEGTIKFLEFFLESNLNIIDDSENCFEERASIFLSQNADFNGEANVYNLELYNFPDDTDLNFKSNFIRSVLKLLSKVKNDIVKKDKPHYPKDIIFNRQVNPDIDVYRFKGNSDLELKYSDDSYSLLFDS